MSSIRPGRRGASVRSTAWVPALLVLSMFWCHRSDARAQSGTDRTGSSLESGVDTSIRPGDDFFAYANGGWLKATTIPAGKERWGARNEIEGLTRQQVATLFGDAVLAPAGSSARKVSDFRAAYLNDGAIEAQGLTPLKSPLDSIDRLRDKTALSSYLGRDLRADVDPLNIGIFESAHVLGLAVEMSIHGEKNNVAFLLQGGLGLPERESYLGTDSQLVSLRARYEQYISRMLGLAGFDHPDTRAKAVMALETALAQSQVSLEASASDHRADTVWTRADFAHRAPGMDWPAFFSAAGLAKEPAIVPWQPGAIAGVAALVTSQSLDAWKDYLRFHLIDRYADVLPQSFAAAYFALHGTVVAGQAEQAPRAQRAFTATQSAIGEALGRVYAEHYLSATEKQRVQAIVANVAAAFRARVNASTWMTPATKQQALTKLRTLYIGIGYPDRWQDYSDLRIDTTDAVGNLRRIEDRNYRQALARLGKPVDKTTWWMAPQTPGAVLIFQQNSYDFSAALLQSPKYDPTASDAANYGAIGAIIGHDISHYIDRLGAEFDSAGREQRWWTAEDSAHFEVLTRPLAEQFSAYQSFPDQNVNGTLTLNENLADLAGIVAAFDAYRQTLGARASDKEYVRQQDRQFFLGFARSFRAKLSDAATRTQVASNDHAPEMFRVSTVRNLDAWYDAFEVRPGDRLYLEPRARVRVW